MKRKLRRLLIIGFLSGCATSSLSLDNSYFFLSNADLILQMEVNDLENPLKKAIKQGLPPNTQRLVNHMVGKTRRVALYSRNSAWQVWLRGRYPAWWIKRSLKKDEGWRVINDEIFEQKTGAWQLLVDKSGRQLFASSDDVQRLISTAAPPLSQIAAPSVVRAFDAHQGLVLFVRDAGALTAALNLAISPGPVLVTVRPMGRIYRIEIRFLAEQLQQLRLISVAIQSSRGLLVNQFPSYANMLSDFDLELNDDGLVWRMHPVEAELSGLLGALLGWLAPA